MNRENGSSEKNLDNIFEERIYKNTRAPGIVNSFSAQADALIKEKLYHNYSIPPYTSMCSREYERGHNGNIKSLMNDLEHSYNMLLSPDAEPQKEEEIEVARNDTEDIEKLEEKIRIDLESNDDDLVLEGCKENRAGESLLVEFEILKRSHEKALITKGKTYKFIYEEISKIEEKYCRKVTELEKELKELRETLKHCEVNQSEEKLVELNQRLKIYEENYIHKDELERYKESVAGYVENWKGKAKQSLAEFIKRRSRGKFFR